MPSLRPQIRLDFDLADRIDAEMEPGEARSTWVNDLLRDTFRAWDEAEHASDPPPEDIHDTPPAAVSAPVTAAEASPAPLARRRSGITTPTLSGRRRLR